MKQLFKCLVASIAVSLVLALPLPANAASALKITEPTTKTKMTVVRSNKNVTTTIKATLNGKSVKASKLKFTTSKKSVATVNKKGVITFKKAGKVKITVKSGKNKAAITFTVKKGKPVTKVIVKNGKTSIKAKSTLTLEKGKTLKVTGSVKPAKATVKTLAFASSKTSVATISSKGLITAKAAGTTTITVSATDGSKKSLTFNVKVTEPAAPAPTPAPATVAVTGVTVDKAVTLATNANYGYAVTAKVVATVSPADATDKTVTFKTSNDKVATVAADGTITAVATGTADITATAGDKTATTKVTVVAGKAFEVVDKAGASDNKTIIVKAANGTTTAKALEDFIAGLDIKEDLKAARELNGYMISYDGSKIVATKNGEPEDVAAKLTSGVNLKNGIFGDRLNARKFKYLSDSIDSTGKDADFGAATVRDGNTSYEFSSIKYDSAKNAKVFNLVNNGSDVKVKLVGTKIYVSSTGDLAGVESLIKAVIGGNLADAK